MTLVAGLLIVGQLVVAVAFVGALALFVGMFIYDIVDNRRRETEPSTAAVPEPTPLTTTAPAPSAGRLIA